MQVLAEFIMEQVDTIFSINIFSLFSIDTQTTLLKTAGKQHVCRVPFWTADVSEVLC